MPQHKNWRLTFRGHVYALDTFSKELHPHIAVFQPVIFTQSDEDELVIYLEYHVAFAEGLIPKINEVVANHPDVAWEHQEVLREGA